MHVRNHTIITGGRYSDNGICYLIHFSLMRQRFIGIAVYSLFQPSDDFSFYFPVPVFSKLKFQI